VQQQANRPSVLSLSLRGTHEAPSIGDSCHLQVSDTELFSGDIFSRELQYTTSGERVVILQAIDKLGKSANRQAVRILKGTTSDIVATLSQMPVTGEKGPQFTHLYQTNQADLDLLQWCCGSSGLYAHVSAGKIHLFTTRGSTSATKNMTLGKEIRTITLRQSDYGLPATVNGQGWQATNSTAFPVTSTKAASTAHGERWILGLLTESAEVLRQRITAEAEQRAALATVLQCVSEGDPTIYPGLPIKITAGSDDYDGVCFSVTHRLQSDSGYICDINTTPPSTPVIDRYARLTSGIISSVDDPDKRNRVKVTYPTYCDLESPWLPVSLPGAGNNQGITCTFSLGDAVLVATTGADLGQAIVLGGIVSELDKDAAPRSGSKHCVHVRTPGGQRVTLDDSQRSVYLETNDGHRIELKPGSLSLHAAGDLNIAAPGKLITITAGKVAFKQG
jgi:hypothetical protein